MAIFAGSRNEGLAYSAVEEEDGTKKKFLHLRVPPKYATQIEHEMLPKQELDFLSYELSGQARNWWKIAEANDLFWPLELTQGSRIRIPF